MTAFYGMDASERIAAEKARLRADLLARRAALPEEGRRRAGRAACERLLALPEVSGARHLFTCLSFGTEIETWGVVEHWLAEGREVYVPRADRATGLLHLHRYPCRLTTLSFGLRQPKRGEPELPAEAIDTTVDAAIVLGVAFDHQGYRLGYGSGFFDRFLAGRPFPAFGLTLDDQVVERLPIAPHDLPMRAVVSEGAVYRSPSLRTSTTTAASPPAEPSR